MSPLAATTRPTKKMFLVFMLKIQCRCTGALLSKQ